MRFSGNSWGTEERRGYSPFLHLTSGDINTSSLAATTHGEVDIKRGEIVPQVAFWNNIEGSRMIQDMVIQGEFAAKEMKRLTAVIGPDGGDEPWDQINFGLLETGPGSLLDVGSGFGQVIG